MTRKLPATMEQPPSITYNHDTKIIRQLRDYEIITPLFGGGVEKQQADPVTVVRASEVRGHLRFWWRATRGGQFGGDLEKMKAAEDAVWGSTSKPSLVGIEVELIGTPVPLRKVRDNRERLVNVGAPGSPISYAAFPLAKAGALWLNVCFRLHLSFPVERREDISTALWAWETFGGIGARTRRGFGAICCQSVAENDVGQLLDLPAQPTNVRDWLDEHLRLFAPGVWHDHIPHLSPSSRSVIITHPDFTVPVGGGSQKPFKEIARAIVQAAGIAESSVAQDRAAAWTAWYYLINRLQTFRQQRHNRFGRSKWPEPDLIRDLSGTYYIDSANPAHSHKPRPPLIRGFPRAAFGLPINFQFKDDQVYKDPPANTTLLQNPDPPGTNRLVSNVSDRWASPLILRPLRCANGSYVSIALLLSGTALPDVLKVELQKGAHPVAAALNEAHTDELAARLGGLPQKPLIKKSGRGLTPADVLTSFLTFLQGN